MFYDPTNDEATKYKDRIYIVDSEDKADRSRVLHSLNQNFNKLYKEQESTGERKESINALKMIRGQLGELKRFGTHQEPDRFSGMQVVPLKKDEDEDGDQTIQDK